MPIKYSDVLTGFIVLFVIVGCFAAYRFQIRKGATVRRATTNSTVGGIAVLTILGTIYYFSKTLFQKKPQWFHKYVHKMVKNVQKPIPLRIWNKQSPTLTSSINNKEMHESTWNPGDPVPDQPLQQL